MWQTSGEQDPLNQVSRDSQSLRLQARAYQGYAPGPLHMYHDCWLDIFVGLTTVEACVSRTIFPALGLPDSTSV